MHRHGNCLIILSVHAIPATQPHALQQLPITLTLKSGSTEVNYPQVTTDQYGFFTVPVHTLANRTYSWRVKGPHATYTESMRTTPGFLASTGTVVLAGAATTQKEMARRDQGVGTTDSYPRLNHATLARRRCIA